MPRFEDLAAEGQALVEVGGAVVGVDVATQAELNGHATDTTDVHGIADTAALATQTYVDTAVGNATSTVGETNKISVTDATSAGGVDIVAPANTYTGDVGVILGGTTASPNTAGAEALAVIGGGYDNDITDGIASTIAGGAHHTANATDGHTFIGGGSTQTVSGGYGVAVGGLSNVVHAGPYSTIGGGRSNVAGVSGDATKSDATIAGGESNTASGEKSFIGGGKSNVASGQYSAVMAGNTGTASGVSAVVMAGNQCQATGDYAFAAGNAAQATAGFTVAIGDYSVASGLGAIALGQRGIADKPGQLTFANGRFSAFGDAQVSTLVAKLQTTTATPTDITLSGLTGSSGKITLSDDTTWAFTVTVVARRSDADNESAGYKFEGVIDRNTGAATTALVGAVTKTVLGEDTAAWDCNVTADTTNGALRVRATGEAAKTIKWVARVELTEVTG